MFFRNCTKQCFLGSTDYHVPRPKWLKLWVALALGNFRIRNRFGKYSDAGKDWGQEEKGTTEDKMAGWCHRLDGHEFKWSPGVGDGQGGLECCDSWGHNESDTTEWLNWTELKKEMGIPDHLTCLLRNLYAGQEATIRTGMEQQTGSK